MTMRAGRRTIACRNMSVLRPLIVLFLGVTLLAAEELVVTAEKTPLLGRCGDGGGVVAELPRGAAVRLRFALAGADNRCYSVSSEVDGRRVAGYVSKADVAGLKEFDASLRESTARRSEAGIGSPRPNKRVEVTPAPEPKLQTVGRDAALLDALRRGVETNRNRKPEETLRILDKEAQAPEDDRDAAVLRADAYLQLIRPRDALAAMKTASRNHPDDPDLLGLSGYAYFLQDRLREAERYLKKSLQARHTPSYEHLLKRVQQESAAGTMDGQAYGSRFNMRFEGEALPDATAKSLVKAFEGELNRVQFKLGCSFRDRLPIIVRTRESYRQASNTAAWSGGHFDGRIHIAVPPSGRADEYVLETFSHELVHACLAQKGRFPVWLHEGLAQMLSGRTLSRDEQATLAQLSRDGKLPTFGQLSGGWGRLGTAEAGVAYRYALLAAETLYDTVHDAGVRTLINNPSRVAAEGERLDRRVQERLRSR